MSELDKVLEWVEKNIDTSYGDEMVLVEGIKDFINELKNPPKKMVWQCRTISDPEWRNIGDGEYEDLQYLARFEFRKVEL